MFEGLLQPTHLILILLIALIVVGPGKLSDLGGSLGKSLREFKQAVNEVEDTATTATTAATPNATAKPQVSAVAAQPTSAPTTDHAETPRA
jgi:sec-independent protein translocase protein TatA